MSFSEQLSADIDNVFFNTNEFAEAVTYTPNGGSPQEITAIVYKKEDTAEFGRNIAQMAEILVKVSDVSAPSKMDKIAVGDDSYDVEEITESNNNIHRLLCSRKKSVDVRK